MRSKSFLLGLAAFASSVMIAAPSPARAQAVYQVEYSTGVYAEITGGDTFSPVAYGSLPAWDEGVAEIPLPFTFSWFGTPYDTAYAYTNGFIAFEPPPAGVSVLSPPTVIPNTQGRVHAFIAPAWADYIGSAAAEIRAQTTGAMGARVFTLQLRGLRTFADPTSAMAFQVRLYEADQHVEIVYGPNNGIGQVGTTAIESASGREGANLRQSGPQCSGACVCVPGGCGSIHWQPAGQTITLRLPPGPDLAGEILAPPGVRPGEAFDVQLRIRNVGLTPAGAFDYELRLAPTRGSLVGSTLLARARVPQGIAAASLFDGTRRLTLPANTPAGVFDLALVIDVAGEVDEGSESNNTAFTRQGLATAPDLTGTVVVPGVSGAGESISVEVAVESTGAPVPTPIHLAMLLSRDDTVDPSDLALAAGFVSLTDGFSGSATFEVALPAALPPSPPSYRVLAVIDDQGAVAELDETDNVALSNPLTVSAPDLVVSSVAGPAFAYRGVVYPTTVTIRNLGGATARDFTLCVVLSENEHVSLLGDPLLFESPPVTLAPGAEERFTLSPVVPAATATGAWFLAAFTDCGERVAESDEVNNVGRRPERLLVLAPAPDFAALEVSAPPRASAGETLPLAARLANLGPAAGSARVRFVLSTDPTIAADDRLLFEPDAPVALAANQETTFSTWATLPSELGSGRFTLGVVVDPEGEVLEAREDDNARALGEIIIDGVGLVLVTPPPPSAVVGVPYVRRFAAAGGTRAYTWSLTFESGAPPAGLSFDPVLAELRGTPEAAAVGRHPFTVRVTSGGIEGREDFVLIVTPDGVPLTIVSSRLPAALAGETYSTQLSAVGGRPPYAWALMDALPTGLQLSAEGVLAGEPQLPGAHLFRVAATDSVGVRSERTLALEIVEPRANITIRMADIPSGVLGEPYTFTFDVEGGVLPYTWSLAPETEIPGLDFDPRSATLTGTPARAGEYPFIIEVHDGAGLFDRNAYVLEILAPGDLRVEVAGTSPEARLPRGRVGQPYLDADGAAPRFTATRRSGRALGPVTWTVVEGALPPGLALEAESGVLSGTPSAAGSFAIRVLVNDPGGDFAFRVFVLEVESEDGGPGGDEGCGCSSTPRHDGAGPSGWTLAGLGLWAFARLRRSSTRPKSVARRRARALAVFGVLWAVIASGSASAQVYLSSSSASTFLPLQGGAPIDLGGDDDDGMALLALPFPFTHYGVTYTHVNLSVNGALTFAAACSASVACTSREETCTPDGLCRARRIRWDATGGIPSVEDPNAIVAAFWDDLFLSRLAPASAILWETLGTAPNREVVFEWRNIRHYRNSASSANFQIRLREAGGLRLQYGPYVSDPADDADWNGYVGIENADGSAGIAPIQCAEFAGTCDFTELLGLADRALDFFVPDRPELVTSVAAPLGVEPGANFDLTLEARNLGTIATSGPVLVRAFLSTDEAITPADLVLGELSVAALGPGASASRPMTVRVPAGTPLGRYRVGAIVDPDGAQAEPIETNNSFVVAEPLVVGPDLIAGLDGVADASTDMIFEVPIRIWSRGAPLASASYAIHLSADATFDPAADLELARGVVPIASSERFRVSVPVSVPSSVVPGEYYFAVRLDPEGRVDEADEINNVAVAAESTSLRGPDVVAVALEGASQIFAGQPYVVTSVLRNEGAGAARSFYYGVYLSENSALTLSDLELGRFGPITLAAGEERRMTQVVTIPRGLAVGPFYMGLLADLDSTVQEGIETNNIRSRSVALVAPASDFTVEGVVSPREVAAGEVFSVERTIRNLGVAGGKVDYALYLSADAVIDPDTDIGIGWGSVGLGPKAEIRAVDRVRIPPEVVRGAYYLAYVLDPEREVGELDEANNVVFAGATVEVSPSALSVVTPAVPAALVGVPYDFRLTASGGTGPYTWRVRGGVLPEGLELDATGRLFGTSGVEASEPVTFAVSDGTHETARTFEVMVAEVSIPLSVATAFLVPGFVDRAYAYPLTALGGAPPYTWTAEGQLPAGLELSRDGVLRGTPLSPAFAVINFQVSDALGGRAERALVVRVVNSNASVRFASDVLPEGAIGEPYDEDVRVAPGTGESPYTFSIASGRLPPGLVWVGPRVQGTPLAPGVYPFEVRVVDARGDVDQNLFLLTIREALGVAITTTSLPVARVGVPYLDEAGEAVVIRAFSTGRPEARVELRLASSDALPPGLELREDGSISGTPTAAGVFPFLVLAEDDVRQRDQRALGILVEAPLEPSPVPEPGCGCSASAEPPKAASGAWLLAILVLGGMRRRFRGLLVVVGLVGALLPSPAEAQRATYRVRTRVEPYVTLAGGTRVVFASTDEGAVRVNLPFPFEYYGERFQDVLVGTNGLIAFGSETRLAALNGALPSGTGPNGVVAPVWDDLVSDDVRTFVEGTAPRRVFIIQVTDARPFIGTGRLSFQIRLFEAPGPRLEVHYGPLSLPRADEWSATSGLESPDGAAGQYFLPCEQACDGAALAAVEDTVFAVFLDAGPDVLPTGLEVPSILYAGRAFDAAVSFTSLHESSMGPFRYALELAEEGRATRGRVVFTSPPLTLSPYETRRETPRVELPADLAEGRYRVVLVGDSGEEVAEPDESNNLLWAEGVSRVFPPMANFRAGRVTTSTQASAPGASFSVTVEVENAGNEAGRAAYSIHLSGNELITPDDLELATGAVDLAPLETRALTVAVTPPATLPPGRYFVGVVLDPSGAIEETSELDNSSASASRLTFTTTALEIESWPLPAAYVGLAYSARLMALGGDGAFSWRVAQGALPEGLNLVPSTGELRGVPRGPGSARFVVAVESAGQTATRALELSVSTLEPGLTIATRALLPGIVGEPYPPLRPGADPAEAQKILVAGARGAVTLRAEGPLPPGLTLDVDGFLHGRPTRRGTFELRVVATDEAASVERTLLLTVAEPGRLTLVAAVLYPVLEAEFVHPLQVIGRAATSTLTFMTEDALPEGLSLSPDGFLGGVPRKVESRTVVVNVFEGSRWDPRAQRDTALFLVAVVPDRRLTLSPEALPPAVIGEPYEATLAARGGEGAITWQVSGVLPAGLERQTERRGEEDLLVLRGVPSEEAFEALEVTATDVQGRSAVGAFALQVTAPPPEAREAGEGCGCATAPRARASAAAWVGLLLAGTFVRRLSSRGRRRPGPADEALRAG